MTRAIRASFMAQAGACEALGSPLTGRVLRALAVVLRSGQGFDDRVLGWSGNPDAAHDALALRVAAGLHFLVLTGQDARLVTAYKNPDAITDRELQGVLRKCLEIQGDFLTTWLDSPPQTNEPRRSAALIAAAHWLADRYGPRMVVSELGASAGLNLIWDRMALRIGDELWGPQNPAVVLDPVWNGPVPPRCRPEIIARSGVDLRPIDSAADWLRLRAYIWPDQHDRLARLDTLAPLVPHGVVEAGDAIAWLEKRLDAPMERALHVVCHTVAWQYFPASAQARGEALLKAAGARATHERPLARLAMEADGGTGAALRLTLWPGGVEHVLARVDFHGRWVTWQG